MNSNLISTLSQSGFITRKLKTPKKPAYFNLLINSFNIKLWGNTTKVEGLNKADEDNLQTVLINTLLKTASLNIYPN